jgi:hypothetical protein
MARPYLFCQAGFEFFDHTGQSAGAGPCPLEHEAQPHQGNQCQLVEKESGNHGNPPLIQGLQ